MSRPTPVPRTRVRQPVGRGRAYGRRGSTSRSIRPRRVLDLLRRISELLETAVDPEVAELHAKQRPALVVAASESAVLVRPIYSNPFSNRTLFHAWRRLHLDHVCYISDERVALEVPEARLEELGRLSDEEWNSLH